MAVKRDFHAHLFTPVKPATRWLDSSVLVFTGLASLLVYYLIRFDICATSRCDEVAIMKFWVSLAWLYIPYGLAQIGVGVFLVKARELARIYRLAIVVTGSLGAGLAGMVVFGVVAELGAIR